MINQILGLESQALKLCEKRALILAKNMANISTPNYKSRDINFAEAFKQATRSQASPQATNSHHIALTGGDSQPKEYYRVPMQTSLDNNTFDDELERKNFAENAMRYQAALSLAQTQVNTLIHAMKGE